MKQLGPYTSEATINLSARPKGLELLGEVSRVPLGQHDDVTFQPQTGELVFKSTQFTLITELGFDRQGFDAAQKQARLKELWEKSVVLKAEIDAKQQYHATLWQAAFKSGYFGHGISFASKLMLQKGWFATPEQVTKLGEECKRLLDACVPCCGDQDRLQQAEAQYNAMSERFFNAIEPLEFFYRVYLQFTTDTEDLKWDPETVARMPVGVVIAIFFLSEFNHFTLRDLIRLNGDDLLQKLSREDIIFIMHHCPTPGHRVIRYVFSSIVTTIGLCHKLSFEDFYNIIMHYSHPDHGSLDNDFAEILLSSKYLLDQGLSHPNLFKAILALVPFHTLAETKLDQQYELNPVGPSIIDYIKPFMTASLWHPLERKARFSQKDAVLILKDEEICRQMAVEDVEDLVCGSHLEANQAERHAIYFQHPAPSDVFILSEFPGMEALEKNKAYRFNYVYVTGERQLYYLASSGYLGGFDKSVVERLYYQDARCPFKIDNFIAQLTQLQQEQGSNTNVHLNTDAIRRLIIANDGIDYTSAGVLRLSKTFYTSNKIDELSLKLMLQRFQEYKNPAVLDSSYQSNVVDLMQHFDWDRGYSRGVHTAYYDLPPPPSPVLPETIIPAEPGSIRAAEPIGPPPAPAHPRPANNVALGIGLSSAALGVIGLGLVKAGAFSSATGPYVWPVTLGLALLGGVILLTLGICRWQQGPHLFGQRPEALPRNTYQAWSQRILTLAQ